MSVQPGPTFKRYAANGVATAYAIPFLLLDAADLQITLNGVPVTTGFILSGIGNPQSTCTFTAAPTGDLLFQQVVPFQRLADYQINGDFLAETVNRDFDRLWLAVKQLSRDSSRALTVSLLEPEGIPPLPTKAVRGLRVLAFDANGNPITSNLSLEQIEQQPALALEAVAQAQQSAADALSYKSAAGDSASAAAGSAGAAGGSAAAAAASAIAASNAGLQMGMSTWGYRPQPFAGFALDDGQELDRAVYPSFAAALDAGLLPTVTQAQWNADPGNRACFVANSSAGKFRMRDRNGMSSGSYGAVFERGGSGPTLIKRDQMQSHKHRTVSRGDDAANTVDGVDTTAGAISSTSPAGASTSNRSLSGLPYTGPNVGDVPTGGGARHGSETYPTHATGAWMTRLFGVITPLGSAEAASLATAYASLATRLMAVETLPRFRRWRSANLSLAVTAAGYTHALGFVPDVINVHVTLTVSVGGWPIGVAFRMSPQGTDIGPPNSYGIQVCNLDASSFSANCASSGILINTTTGAQVAVTLAQCTVQVELLAWA
ncbi:hypothetical protein HX823_09450 [Pseudomonas sp. P7759]|uniref:hypothetical protein n=1 Tax=Pseudomonas sp. P7759 TaxID=2738831 RepID=UPI0015A01442|nr:hypothetical protein [Pseudomonas sp. P7759]NWC74302.1 hypothetical protein [Pseudomonas sp. P7759]